jgi:hypothetical protein
MLGSSLHPVKRTHEGTRGFVSKGFLPVGLALAAARLLRRNRGRRGAPRHTGEL